MRWRPMQSELGGLVDQTTAIRGLYVCKRGNNVHSLTVHSHHEAGSHLQPSSHEVRLCSEKMHFAKTIASRGLWPF